MAPRLLPLWLRPLALMVGVGMTLLPNRLPAVVIAGGNGNISAPTDDPGFAYVGTSSTGGASVTYLGNGWCLTAGHVTLSNTFGGLAVNGQYYQVTQVVSSPFAGADLKLFQINGDPGLAPLKINGNILSNGSSLTMIGNGLSNAGQQYWTVTVPTNGSTSWTWVTTAGGGSVNPLPSWSGSALAGTYQASGFSTSNHAIRWGQSAVTQGSQFINNTNSFYTTFNDPTYAPGQPTFGANEAQAILGDSGGGVFYKDPVAGWELAGVMIAQGTDYGQPAYTAVFGNTSVVADLSQYRSAITPVVNPFTWTGQTAGSGPTNATWDTISMNWAGGTNLLANPNSPGQFGSYRDGTSVVFGDQNAANGNSRITTTAVAIQSLGVSPISVTFNNSAVNYSLSDSGAMGIGGATGITKLGTGSVTLLGSNSFTGPVYINAGRINVQNGGALGTSSVVTVNSGAALELQGNVAIGAIPLTLSGAGLAANPAGALNSVGGNNSYSGPITIASGGATINSAAPGAILTLSGGITNGGNPLIFSGAGNTSVTTAISGSGSLIKSGNGWLSLNAANSYTGGITVTGGTLSTSVLGDPSSAVVVSAASGVSSALILGSTQGQTVSSLAGTVASSGSASIAIAGGDTLTVNQAVNTTFGGSIINSGTVIKLGAGTLEIDGNPTLAANSNLQVNGGTLLLNLTSGSATVGTGVTATAGPGATLQLAGTVSALSSGANAVNIANNSQAAGGGLLVTGTNQQVGAISGTGNTVINAGSNLTASSIVQNSLVIGGAPGRPATLTIAASGPNGTSSPASLDRSPLTALTDSSDSAFSSLFNPPLSATSVSQSPLLNGAGSVSTSAGGTVPEPSSMALAAAAALGLAGLGLRRLSRPA
ncbi:MAG TPA: autotransporter-associated beta strand repeat-containing protein [Pirellulales bacterium]|nr:autotransporter-associated beta strand repeat-containing protein [Pirellulales bacterium]